MDTQLSTLAPNRIIYHVGGHANTTEPGNATAAPPQERNQELLRIEIAVQAAIFCLAVLGNGLVLFILRLKRSKLSRMNIMIVHLCFADLFVAFCNVLPQMLWDITFYFEGGDVLCRLVKYIQVVAMYASSYVLICTAIDRWLVICHPLTSHTWTNRHLHLMVGVAWLLALIFSVPQTIIFSLVEFEEDKYNCWANLHPAWKLKLYITWFTVAVYIVPTAVLILAYGRICYAVWSSMYNKECVTIPVTHVSHENGRLLMTSCNSGPRAHARGLSRAKVKTVKLTLTVIICYLLCWGPFFVAQMWAAWDENAPFEESFMVICVLLASLNSCVNPWIFLAFSETCGGLGNQASQTRTGAAHNQYRPFSVLNTQRQQSTDTTRISFALTDCSTPEINDLKRN